MTSQQPKCCIRLGDVGEEVGVEVMWSEVGSILRTDDPYLTELASLLGSTNGILERRAK